MTERIGTNTSVSLNILLEPCLLLVHWVGFSYFPMLGFRFLMFLQSGLEQRKKYKIIEKGRIKLIFKLRYMVSYPDIKYYKVFCVGYGILLISTGMTQL